MSWFEGFESGRWRVNGVELFARHGGTRGKPALLLLHGFPQTHALWHRVARQLAPDYFIVLPDLRGYGDSSQPPGLPDHANYSKRELARDLADLMVQLGAPGFFVCGHDRGGRVAHRMALDHPRRVKKLCVLDIAPTLDMYAGNWGQIHISDRPSPAAGKSVSDPKYFAFARGYYHWFFLIQPAPLPETLIGGDPKAYLHAKLGGWGAAGLGHIEPQALAEYERCFCRPEAIHAMCEDYRASAGIDLEHDRESRAKGEKIACDTMVLWGDRGLVGRLFDPVALWQAQCAGHVSGQAVPSGHFIPEERPQETADALWSFFRE
ncbi:MAG TPA: alpha/beta hydrolase [Ramlibacter sp.]|nr:alpha/beta hydrolase [Ramlibacter sp.]